MSKKVRKIMATVVAATSILTVGCGNKDVTTNNDVTVEIDENKVNEANTNQSSNKIENDNTEEEVVEDETPEIEGPNVDATITLSLEKTLGLEKSYDVAEPQFSTPWKSNQSGNTEICIEGRGPEAIEEGFGVIYIKSGNNMDALTLNSAGDSLAPTYVEWIDDDSFVVILGSRYGRIRTSGSIYKVELDSLNMYKIYDATETEELSEASKIADDIINIKILEHQGEAVIAVEKNIKIQ